MKKKIIIAIICILFIILSVLGYVANIFYEEYQIASTITIEINPSIEINLNKNEKVISVIPLNEDAKEIISDNIIGENLDETLKIITNNIVDKGYVKDNEVTILLNITGKVEQNDVESIINNNLKQKDVNTTIIVSNMTKTSSKNAKKYDISEAKAAYIESILENNSELTFDDLKDKSINELNEIDIQSNPLITEKVQESDTKETTDDTDNSNSTPIEQNSSNNTASSCNPPSELKDSAWCTFNTSRPQWCEYNYSQKISSYSYSENFYSRLGLGQFDVIGSYTTEMPYTSSSYCLAYVSNITTRQYRYTIIYDSVTGEVYEERKDNLPATVDENVVKQDALNYFNVTEEDCNTVWVSFGTEGEGSSNWYYRYQVNMELKDGTIHSIDYNAVTGNRVQVNR